MVRLVLTLRPGGKKEWVPMSTDLTSEQLAAIASQVDMSTKVDKIPGKGLSANDYTNEDKQKVISTTSGGITLIDVKTDAAIADALTKKHSNSSDHAPHSDDQNLTNYVQTNDSRLHASGSDNQDLSGLQPKETGKGLYPDADAMKLAGVAVNANNYSHPANHAASVITQDTSNRFVSDTEKTSWNGKTDLSTVKTDVDIASAISLKHSNASDHSHSNKTTLDAYTQTEVNLADAVTKRHASTLDHNGTTQDTAIAGKNPIRLFVNLGSSVVTSGTTEKILLQLAIPANRAVVGSTFRCTILGNSSSTGTLIFKIREGAGGVITDAIAWTAITSAAQAANKRAGFDAIVTVRSATTNYTDGIAYAGTLQLETVIAVPATSVIAISGIWYISLTVICSSGTFTAQIGSIEEIR